MFSRFAFTALARNRNIASAVMVIGTQRLLQIAGTLITIPLILHALGPASFGVWGAATSLIWLGGMLDIGLGAALITLVAQGIATQDFPRLREHITTAILSAALVMLLVLVCGCVFVWLHTQGEERIAFLIAIIALAVNIPLSLAHCIWMGLQKTHVAGAWDMVQTIANITGIVLAASLHMGLLPMVGIFYGSTVFAYALSMVHLLFSQAVLRPQKIRISADIWRQVLTKSSLLMGISVVICLSYALDNVITLAVLGAIASAQMAIALRIGINTVGIINALTQPLWPAFADAAGKGDHAWSRRVLAGGTLLMVLVCSAGGAVIAICGHSFLQWWLPEDLGISKALLWTTAFWILAISGMRVVALFMNAVSILRFQLIVCTITSLTALVLKFYWVHRFGLTGILMATTASWIIILWPAYLWRIGKWWRDSNNPNTQTKSAF